MSGPLIQLLRRRDLAANWTAEDPILAEGEIGYETDTGWHKIGDGTALWTELGYYHGPPWWGGLDGGAPDSTFPGGPVPADQFGVMCYPDATIKSIVSTSVFTHTGDFSGQQLLGMTNDGNGNWVLIENRDHIWYSSDPGTAWTETASTIQAQTDPSSVAVNDSGLWIAFGFGQNTVYTSTDLGVTWIERRDQTTNYNGVNFLWWSPTLSTFFTNGQNQSRLTTDGITWTGGQNGGTATPRGFTDTGSALYVWGHSGAYVPRNGFTQDANMVTWTMENDFPVAAPFNGTPDGPGDYDGTTWAIVASNNVNYRYWTSTTMDSWNSSTDLRYDSAKTDGISLLRYIPAEQKWYLITDVGDVYWSSDPAAGESGWTEITTGNMVGEIPANYLFSSVGDDAWMYVTTLNKLIVNVLG